MDVTESCKLATIDGTINMDEKDCSDGDANNKENNSDVKGSGRQVWEGTEEEQMEWALAESAKSAEKRSRAESRGCQVDGSEMKFTGKSESFATPPANNGFLPHTNINSKDDPSKEDCTKNNLNVNMPASEDPVWARSEEEQIKWALAESAKSADGDDFVLISDISDEDLVNAAQESGTDEPMGLKGGGPIVTQSCPDDLVIVSNMNNSSMVNDEIGSHKNCSENSDLEQNTAKKPFILRNSPIICVKRKHRKAKTLEDCDVLSKTPTLGKFNGNLFDDVPIENKVTSKCVSPRGSSSEKFRDEDMEKAINMSLQDQTMFHEEEDDELKRALQLSLQEFERKCPAEDQPASPANMDVGDTENLTGSAIQDEESDLSTHSYRLISIVSHLGTRSTSGHYISDVYDCKTKQWTSYDDSTATKVAEHGVRYKRQQSGYIFFYLYKQCVDAIENSTPSKENKMQ